VGAAYRSAASASIYTLESHIRYLSEVPIGEKLNIVTRVLGHDSKRLRLHHTMVRAADNSMVAVTEILAMHVEKPNLRSAAFPLDAISQFAALQSTAPFAAVSDHWRSGAA
jgi:acyl-CoA thioesterase FadM